jgi:hypothetical protein
MMSSMIEEDEFYAHEDVALLQKERNAIEKIQLRLEGVLFYPLSASMRVDESIKNNTNAGFIPEAEPCSQMTIQAQYLWFHSIQSILGNVAVMDMKSVLSTCQRYVDQYNRLLEQRGRSLMLEEYWDDCSTREQSTPLSKRPRLTPAPKPLPEIDTVRSQYLYRRTHYFPSLSYSLSQDKHMHYQAQLCTLLMEEWTDLEQLCKPYTNTIMKFPTDTQIEYKNVWKLPHLLFLKKSERLSLALPSLGIFADTSRSRPDSPSYSLNPYKAMVPRQTFIPYTREIQKRYPIVHTITPTSRLKRVRKQEEATEQDQEPADVNRPDSIADATERAYYLTVVNAVESWINFDMFYVMTDHLMTAFNVTKGCMGRCWINGNKMATLTITPLPPFGMLDQLHEIWTEEAISFNNYLMGTMRITFQSEAQFKRDSTQRFTLAEQDQIDYKVDLFNQRIELLINELYQAGYNMVANRLLEEYGKCDQRSKLEREVETSIRRLDQMVTKLRKGVIRTYQKTLGPFFQEWDTLLNAFDDWANSRLLNTKIPVTVDYMTQSKEILDQIQNLMISRIQVQLAPFNPLQSFQETLSSNTATKDFVYEELRKIHIDISNKINRRINTEWMTMLAELDNQGSEAVKALCQSIRDNCINVIGEQLKLVDRDEFTNIWLTGAFAGYKIHPTQKINLRRILNQLPQIPPCIWMKMPELSRFTVWDDLRSHWLEHIDNPQFTQFDLMNVTRFITTIALRSERW